MYVGPGGASGLCSGSVAIHALKATRNWGRKRRTAIASFCGLFKVNAINHALNVEASKLRSVLAVRSSRVARLPSVEARAMSTRDAVPHCAAEYPAQAAVTVTSASSTASQTCTIRE